MNSSENDVIAFWFSKEVSKYWFNSTEEFDELLINRFMTLYNAAKNGDLDHWVNTERGALALVILLDQFPLNMFRGKAECFDTEAQARRIADIAIENGLDEKLTSEQKTFLYLPFMHSENLADQDKAIKLYEKAGSTENLKYARQHRDIVERFARFPHRNTMLGRKSTPAEEDYLNAKGAFHG